MEEILQTLMNVTKFTVGRMESIAIFNEIEVTEAFIEFVFKNCSEEKAIELANFITDKRREEL